MNGTSGSLMLVFVVVVTIALFLMCLLIMRTWQANINRFDPPEKKPGLLQSLSPRDAAPGYAEGTASEKLAAPFAEQIEDIIHDLVAAEPALTGILVDFGTAPDGTLEIWVNDKRYADVGHVPDERIRAVIQQAIAMYNEQHTKS